MNCIDHTLIAYMIFYILKGGNMSKYKVKSYNHISDSDYTLEQAKERVEYLNSTFKGCNAHMDRN